MEFAHKTVLLHETVDMLNVKPDGIYLDGTLGGAGHSLEICKRLTTGRLIGVDRDTVALEAAKKRLYRHAKKVTLVHDNFENVGAILTALGLDRILRRSRWYTAIFPSSVRSWTRWILRVWTGCFLTSAFHRRSSTMANAAFPTWPTRRSTCA